MQNVWLGPPPLVLFWNKNEWDDEEEGEEEEQKTASIILCWIQVSRWNVVDQRHSRLLIRRNAKLVDVLEGLTDELAVVADLSRRDRSTIFLSIEITRMRKTGRKMILFLFPLSLRPAAIFYRAQVGGILEESVWTAGKKLRLHPRKWNRVSLWSDLSSIPKPRWGSYSYRGPLWQ